jgi:uncharacterized protein
MKILTFTDVHCDAKSMQQLEKKSKKADFLVCAGDLTIFGRDYRELLEEINSFKKPCFIVPGNHETEELLDEAAFGLINIHNVDKKIIEFGEYLIIGYGGGGFALKDERFEKIAKIFKKKITKLKKKDTKIIFITHQPPHNTKVDLIHKQHAGSKSYTQFIKETKPHLVLCGHLHETAKKKDKIGKSLVVNPGWEGMFLEL